MDANTIRKLVVKILGQENKKVEEIIERGTNRDYDRDKFYRRLRQVLDSRTLASTLSDSVMDQWIHWGRKSKRKHNDDDRRNGQSKKSKREERVEDQFDEIKSHPNGDIKAATTVETTAKIMEDAHHMIEQRRKDLNLIGPSVIPVQTSVQMSYINKNISASDAEKFMNQMMDKEQRMAMLKAKIGNSMQTTGLSNLVAISTKLNSQDAAKQKIDTEESRAKARRNAFFKTQQVATYESTSSQYSDPRIDMRPAMRAKRQFKFVKQGDFEVQASRERNKAKLDKLQAGIESASKKTGISSAVKLAMVAPKTAQVFDTEIPTIEWWDMVIVPDDVDFASPSMTARELENVDYSHNQLICNLIEHPVQMKPADEPEKDVLIRTYLTKKEQKKLRRQNRKEANKEKIEKIRLGMEPPPEPKMKMSNLMRVLGEEAVQNPTKMEQKVREQIAARFKKHQEANEARKLTKAQRNEKAQKKLADDNNVGVYVGVFRVKDLANPKHKFKVEMNAKQLQMTGAVVLSKDTNVVVVEGSQKQLNFYKRLMLHRIKWNETKNKQRFEEEEEGPTDSKDCELLWEGIVKQKAFRDFTIKILPLNKQASEFFTQRSVPEYWDMALSSTILSDEIKPDVDII